MADRAATRVVIRPPNWLGDAVLALPAIGALRRHFPSAHVTIAAVPAVAAVFNQITPAAPNQVIELPASSAATKAMLRSGAFDVGVLFPNSFRSAWQLYRGGVRERWGYPTAGRGLLLTKRSGSVPKASPHQSDYYRALVRGLDVVCGDDLPAVEPSAAGTQQADTLLARAGYRGGAPLVVLLPGAAYGQAKQWPPARMAELASRLMAEHGAVCVLAGAEHDRPAARAIESWLRARTPAVLPRLIDLVGHTSIGALTGVLARAAVCVSNDSGGMHLASAVGRPVVAIFGPTNERATSPAGRHDLIVEPVFCRPCMLRDCPIDHRCMKRITVDRAVRRDGPAPGGSGRRMSGRPAVFLDRDGTLIHDVGYFSGVEDVQWFPSSIEAIRLLNRAGFLVCITTNQGGIALGFYQSDLVERVHVGMCADVEASGGRIDALFFCPHHPLAITEALRLDCDCRKPRPGMIHQATARFEIDLARSFVVGDKMADIGLATNAGARGILVKTGYGHAHLERYGGPPPGTAHVAETVFEATSWILTEAGFPKELA